MLACTIREWTGGDGWVLEPKYDGYRLFIETTARGRVCAWSRHGTSLTERVGELLAPVAALGGGWVFDGELIALTEGADRPVQDFAAVGRAVFGGDRSAIARLHYVAFDVLAAGDLGDIQAWSWRERTALLAERFPAGRRLRVVRALPAEAAVHARLVSMGFEGSVLKRPGSTYRAGRCRSWRKLKARHTVEATVRELHRDREGRVLARCELDDGRRSTVWADEQAHELVGRRATVLFSRADAAGGLREARLTRMAHQSAHDVADAIHPPDAASSGTLRRVPLTGVGEGSCGEA